MSFGILQIGAFKLQAPVRPASSLGKPTLLNYQQSSEAPRRQHNVLPACSTVYFETSETKPNVYPNKVSEQSYPNLLSLFYGILIFVSITEQYSYKYILFCILPRATGQVRYNYWKRLDLNL